MRGYIVNAEKYASTVNLMVEQKLITQQYVDTGNKNNPHEWTNNIEKLNKFRKITDENLRCIKRTMVNSFWGERPSIAAVKAAIDAKWQTASHIDEVTLDAYKEAWPKNSWEDMLLLDSSIPQYDRSRMVTGLWPDFPNQSAILKTINDATGNKRTK